MRLAVVVARALSRTTLQAQNVTGIVWNCCWVLKGDDFIGTRCEGECIFEESLSYNESYPQSVWQKQQNSKLIV